MLSGRRAVGSRSTKKTAAGLSARANSISRIFARLREDGGPSTAARPVAAGPAVARTTSTTARRPDDDGGGGGRDAKLKRPSWFDYQRVFDKVDNLKIQLPLFGADRMFDQFFALLDPLGDYHHHHHHHHEYEGLPPSPDREDGAVHVADDDESRRWPDDSESSDALLARMDLSRVAADDGRETAGESGEVASAMDRGRGEDGNDDDDDDDDDGGCDDEDDADGEDRTGDGGVDCSEQFYTLSFVEMVDRYVFRALVSPFDLDTEYAELLPDDEDADYADADITFPSSGCAAVYRGLNSYLERAKNFFGKAHVASMVQLRQSPVFRIEQLPAGSFVRPFANASGGGGSGSLASRKRKAADRAGGGSDSCGAYRLAAVHRDLCRRFSAIAAEQQLAVVARSSRCGCCVSAIRLIVYDHVSPTSGGGGGDGSSQGSVGGDGGPEGFDVLQFARATQQTCVLFNVASVLYRRVAADKFADNFDIGRAHKGVPNGEQSRASFAKTANVQRMAFYRRVYAVHAAVYAIVTWLWYRQVVRHLDFMPSHLRSRAVHAGTTPPPPIILTANRRLAQIFTRVNSVYMQLLLQKQRIFFEFV